MSSHPLSERFEEALVYATQHHRQHRRKGSGIPYMSHLLSVAAISMEMEVSEDEVIAALLHDVVEDDGGPEAEAEIRERFGEDVARMVIANSDSLTGSSDKAPWQQRKQDYIDSIPAKSPDEVRVSIADKLHNARSIVRDRRRHGEEIWKRFTAGRDKTLWYYRSLVEAFEERRDEIGEPAADALDELVAIVGELERDPAGAQD